MFDAAARMAPDRPCRSHRLRHQIGLLLAFHQRGSPFQQIGLRHGDAARPLLHRAAHQRQREIPVADHVQRAEQQGGADPRKASPALTGVDALQRGAGAAVVGHQQRVTFRRAQAVDMRLADDGPVRHQQRIDVPRRIAHHRHHVAHQCDRDAVRAQAVDRLRQRRRNDADHDVDAVGACAHRLPRLIFDQGLPREM